MINLNNTVEDIKVEMGTASRSRTGLSSGRLDASTWSFAAYMWKACIDVTCLSNHIHVYISWFDVIVLIVTNDGKGAQGFLRVRCHVCAGSKCLVSFFSCKHTPSESQKVFNRHHLQKRFFAAQKGTFFSHNFCDFFLGRIASLIAGTLSTEQVSMLGFLHQIHFTIFCMVFALNILKF